MRFTASQFRDLCAALQHGADGEVRSYVPRGGDKPCVAVTLRSISSLWDVALGADTYTREPWCEIESADIDELGAPCVDTLGKGWIAYWPSVPWQGEG